MDDEEAEICPAHGRELVEGVVPVIYGFTMSSPAYGRAWRTLFPRARSYVPGGCSIAPGRPQTAVVSYCPECREAEEQWLAEHPDDYACG